MASHDSEDSRIHDGVRDSKIRLDSPWKFNQKVGSFTSELNRSKGGNGCHEEECYLSQYITSRIRMKIRFFNGTPDHFVDWVDTVEDFFIQMDIPEQLKCEIASYALEGGAEHWWQQLQHHRTLRGKSKIYTWLKMKSLLFNEFLPTMCSTEFPSEANRNEHKGISICESTGETHNLCLLRTTCSTKCLFQSYNSSQTESIMQNAGNNKDHSAGEEFAEEQSKEMSEAKPTKCVMELPMLSSNETTKDEDQIEEATDTTVVTHLKFKPACSDTTVHLDADILLPKQRTLLAGSIVLNFECDQTLMEESQMESFVNCRTPTIKNSIAMLNKSAAQTEHEKVNEVYWMTPEAIPSSLINHRHVMEDFVGPYMVQRCKFVKVGVVRYLRNEQTQLWVLVSWLEAYSRMVVLLFDPGGNTYLLTIWSFKKSQLSWSDRLTGSIIGTIIFTLHSNGVIGNIFANILKNPTVDFGKIMCDFDLGGNAIAAYMFEGLRKEFSMLSSYRFVTQLCNHFSSRLTDMHKQRGCPYECREAACPLVYAPADFADLPEFRDLKNVSRERHESSVKCYAKEFSYTPVLMPPSTDTQLPMQEKERLALKGSAHVFMINRFVFTSVDAYLTPFIKRYLSRFLSKFDDVGKQVLIRQPSLGGYAVWMNVGSINSMISLLGAGIMSFNRHFHSYIFGDQLPKAVLLHGHHFATILVHSKLKYQGPLKYISHRSFLKKEVQDNRSNLLVHISHGKVVAGYRNELDKVGTCLMHEIGACNCFFNVILQPLWPQRRFRYKFLQGSVLEHAHVEGVSCVVYALFDISTILSPTSMNTRRDDVIPTSLRTALRTLYLDHNLFEDVKKEYSVEALKFHLLSEILESELNQMRHYLFYLQSNIELACEMMSSIQYWEEAVKEIRDKLSGCEKSLELTIEQIPHFRVQSNNFNRMALMFSLGKCHGANGILSFYDGLMGEMGIMILEMELFSKELWWNLPINIDPDVTRGRVIPWEGWKDENNSNTEEKLIIVHPSTVTIFASFRILFPNGKFKKIWKLFHMLVNGLDPPMELIGELGRPQWESYEFARGRAFRAGGWNDVGHLFSQWAFNLD